MVLLAHANLFISKEMFHGLFIQGWSGVDFFFVLSGFIIFYNHYRDIGNRGKISLYIKKRIIRVYPIYWIYTIFVLIGFWGLKVILDKNLISWIEINAINIFKCFLLYPTNAAENQMPFLPVAWTLSYEIFFYFVFGAIIFFKNKISRVILSIWIICIILKSIHIIPQSEILLINLMLETKNYEFIIGCIIAFIYIKQSENRTIKRLSPFCIIIGFLWLCFSWINANKEYSIIPDINHAIMFGIPYGMIIIGLLFYENRIKINIILKKVLIFFGNASYSIYLTHYMVIILLIPIFKSINNYITFVLISTIALIIGCIGYNIIEEPLLKILRQKIIKNNGVRTNGT